MNQKDEKALEKEMHAAIANGDVDRVISLVASAPSLLNKITYFGSWLHVAAASGKQSVVSTLLGLGIDVNLRGGILGGNALNEAASEGNVEIMKMLLAAGATMDVDEPQHNPLFGAIYDNRAAAARLLIDQGIDITVRYSGNNMKNMDAYSFAKLYGRGEIAEYLTRVGMRDYPEDQTAPPPIGDDVIQHMAKYFGRVDDISLREVVRTHGVSVHTIHRPDCLVLFTVGMSKMRQSVPKGKEKFCFTELYIRLPPDWRIEEGDEKTYWPVRWLRGIAAYPKNIDSWLGGPFTVISNGEPPEPVASNTKMSCFLLLQEPGDAGTIQCADGKEIVLYSINLLYTEERDFERRHGIVRLLERLQQNGVGQIVELGRPNVGLEEN